jgi:Ethanolamine utilization protein EutJ (predicted chaperonin)
MNSLRSLIPTDKLNIMNNQLKEILRATKQPLFAGIDVGAEELVLVIRKNNKPLNAQTNRKPLPRITCTPSLPRHKHPKPC